MSETAAKHTPTQLTREAVAELRALSEKLLRFGGHVESGGLFNKENAAQLMREAGEWIIALASQSLDREAEVKRVAIEECAKVAYDWLSSFSHKAPRYVSGQTWANDAVKDIADAIRALAQQPAKEPR